MKKSKSPKSHTENEKHPKSIHQISRKRLWIFRFILFIVIPILFISLFELSLRLVKFGYPTAPFIEADINATTYVHDNPAFAYRFFPKKIARQFIPLRFEAAKPEDTIRIFILGASAAQGIPDPAYSFGRILEVMLQLRYPDTQFEVFSFAMPAINSHVVLEIARQSIDYDPDLFVVYLGNNEVIGPYGPGTVLTSIGSNMALLRLGIRFKGTKISQLMNMGLQQLNMLSSPFDDWKGMEMFAENQVQLNDPRLETTYRNFGANLEELNQISSNNGLKIIYSTVVSNLKDCPPFSSAHRADLKLSDQQKWDALYASGSAHEDTGAYAAAIAHYLEALKIDSHYADLHYKLGRCYWQTNNFTDARKSYISAREYDTNRFRADNRINATIRRAAMDKPGTTFLTDALTEIEQKSPHGVPGKEFFHEHVHLNFKGNYLVARTVLKQIEHALADELEKQRKDETVEMSDSLCATYLAYNHLENFRIAKSVVNGFFKRPPFTNQLYHAKTVEHLEASLDSLQNDIQVQGFDQAASTYEDALRKRPSDWWLHQKYADYLADNTVRKYQEAANHFQFVIKTIPHDPKAYVERGVVLAKLGQLQKALDHFQNAITINPTTAKAYFNSGLIYQKMKRLALAVENYRQAIHYQPTHAKAYNNMAFIYSQQGDVSKAIAIIEQGLKASPSDLRLNYNKAVILYQNGRKQEAIEHLRHAIRVVPNEVKLREQLSDWLSKEK